ncbi:MAG: hypothetical protein C0501_04285 [Isosphaera sp.]|nr:hypothetical protein [Isosphaera sp.]
MTRLIAAALAAAGAVGCHAVRHPAPDGIPVRRLPDEVFADPAADLRRLPPDLFRVTPPAEYRLDRGDVLAVVADEVVTRADQPVPVQPVPDPTATRAAVPGVPVPVADDGTILLPLLDPIDVRGRTPAEVRALIADQVVNKKRLVVPGKERVLVEVLRPRRYRVEVVREDLAAAGENGTAAPVLLEPGRNDLFHALVLSGGPPGPDAGDEAVIRRAGGGLVRVPLRARPGHPPLFAEADLTLEDGDAVHVAARCPGVYYTSGRCGSGEFPLPAGGELRVVEAVARAGGGRAVCATVVRRLANGQSVRVRIDLDEALRDGRENIPVRAGDVIVVP